VTFQVSGAQAPKPTRYAPIWTDSFFHGLVTQRNPLRGPAGHIENRFYPTYDAMIDGNNVEISTRLTPIRRYGNSVYNSQTFTNVDSFYSFNLFSTNSEHIDVMVDTAAALYEGTGPSDKNLVWTKSTGAGQSYMQSVGNTLFFGNGVDQKKWVETLTVWTASTAYTVDGLGTFLIDSNGNIEQLTNAILPIATVATDSAVPQNVTITYSGGTNLTTVFTAGQSGTFSGLTTATFLNGIVGTVTTVNSGSVVFSTTLTGHASYGPAADTGLWTAAQGGTPVTGSLVPVWNITVGGTTNDNTAQWTNRGNPVENWGIAAPTTAPTVVVGASNVSWQPHTFYSNAQVNVDTQFGGQTNIWNVTAKGVSDTTNPFTSNPTAGVTTVTDGTVTWTCVASTHSSDSAWTASTTFPADSLIVANASGTNCLFQLQPNAFPVYKLVAGEYVTANFYPHNNGTFSGQCELRNPIDESGHNPGVAPYTLQQQAFNTSVLFNPGQLPTSGSASPLEWATISAAGDITGYTTPYSGAVPGNYTLVVFGTLTVPTAGQYSFTIFHDDGMFWGIGTGTSSSNQATVISGPNNCPAPAATVTALQGYKVMGANNTNGVYQDTFVINFPTADSYPFEIDFGKSNNSGQFLAMYCNGQTPVPGTAETGLTQPIWPAFTTSFAPAYPSVSEANNAGMGSLSGNIWNSGGTGKGPLTWNNIGPITDYSWHSDIQYLTTANSTIIDPANNTEDPYEAGITGTTPPVFATGINQLTKDNPNLIWINQGPASAPPPGTLSTFNGGWVYWIALVNTLTNTVSNLSPASATTGNFIGSAGVKVSGGLPAVIDPQVDYVAIFRSLDGGATPFLIPGTGNTVYTVSLANYQANGYTDTTPDSGLNILLEGPIGLQNTPPGVGAINLAYHLSRIFFSIGNVVFWTSGPDAPIGNGIEGVAPTNNATFPSLVKRLVPTSVGLFVYTVSDIYLISGNGTANSPLFPVPYLPGKGISSYNAVAINGTLTYIFTTTSTVMTVDPNGGFWDLGFPIGDQFTKSNWNPANVYLTWHENGEDVALFVCDGSTGWFRGNPTPSPESGQTWSPFATIVGGVKAIASIETTPGIKKLLLGSPSSGPILARDLTTYADNGTAYTAFFTIGSLVLAQPGQLAELAFITTDSQAIGTKPAISVRLDEISGNYEPLGDSEDDPPKLAPSLTTYAQRFYLLNGDNPALCRHMQIRLDWPSENAGNELLSMTLYGGFIQEK